MGRIPDRWLKYTPIGSQIEGTNFIAFKVPLDMSIVEAEGIGVKMDDMLNIQIINKRIPNLGLVIDLTNTKKYYNSKNITDLGIEYKKIFVPGHVIPDQEVYRKFTSTVTDFLGRNASNDKLIGVHCTHGLNRTGLMICYYMIEKCNIPADDAISRFEKARGHKMERDNYLKSLKQMTPSRSSEMVSNKIMSSSLSKERSTSPAIIEHNNCRTIKTQTTSGVWLDTSKLSGTKRKRRNDHSSSVRDVASIQGILHVNGQDLIDDGFGGYLLRVNLNDIKPVPSSSHHGSNYSQTSHRPSPFYRSNNPNGSNLNTLHTSSYRIDRRIDDSTGSPNFRDNQKHLASRFSFSRDPRRYS